MARGKIMVSKTVGGLSPAEFDELIDHFIEEEDPYAISLDVLLDLDAPRFEAEQSGFEFVGRVVGKQKKGGCDPQ